MTPTKNPQELAQKALSTLSKAEPPPDLAAKAFAAAMRAEPVKPFAELLLELFRVSRFAAAGACAVAGVLVVVAVARADDAGGVTVSADVSAEDAWVAQVLPLSTGDT